MRVNGRIAAQLGTKVTSGVDKVTCDGKPVTPAPGHLYLMLHKPAGVLTSLSDPRERPVIGDLLPARGLPRLFPVGRLDYHTEGLVLLTNDGALAHGLMHPSFEIEKGVSRQGARVPNARRSGQVEGGGDIGRRAAVGD
ncbi:MAG: pseudouridine synthase [Candidatus Methylomirabilis sp.]|nr:pseudouridine synthase [Candidatus Methylomirabilis sp.]